MTSAPLICHVSTVHDPSDTRISRRELPTLSKAFGQIALVTARKLNDSNDPKFRIISIGPAKSRLHRFLLSFKAIQAARNSGARIIHFHDPELLLAVRLVRRISSSIFIYDVHEYLPEMVATKNWILPPLRHLVAPLVGFAERLLARSVDALVVVNDDMQAIWRQRVGHKVKRVISVYNYPSLDDFPGPYPYPRGESSPLILYSGLLHHERGLETMAEAMLLVRKVIPDAICRVIGRIEFQDASAQFRSKNGEWLTEAGIALAGWVPFEQVIDELARARVCWLPWRPSPNNIRGIPNKMIEYMAAARPIVASNIGNIAAIVSSSRSGILVEPENPRAHADAIIRLLKDPDLGRSLGENGRQAFERRFLWEKEGEKLVQLYQELLG